MKITDTLKQIIEKVEPYMDKTLSEGCLIKQFGKIQKIYEVNSKNEFIYINGGQLYFSYIQHTSTIGEYKILGHLDITAVLKYIESNIAWHTNYSNALGKDYFYFGYYEKDNQGEIVEYDFKMPNKPLSLYTEEELKHLLEILNNIENND